MAAAPNPPGQIGDRATKAWNGWLEERDQAPGEVLAGWLKEKTLGSFEAARDFAQAGINIAKSRADVARAGGALLENGGEAAREGILMKQQISQTIAADSGILQALKYYSQHYRQEAAFQTEDLDLGAAFSRRGTLYAKALEVLGEPPEGLGMTPVERDAAALVRISQATAGIGRPLSLAGSDSGGSSLAALLAGGFGSSSSAPAPGDDKFEKLLKELFRLHDLDGDGAIGETELVKLNQKIALLHYGTSADKAAVREKFSGIFRRNLDSEGRPVGYPAFREHTVKMLTDLDPSQPAQEMILEQFIAEAELGREAFHDAAFHSMTDAEFLPHLWAERPKDAAAPALSPVADASPPAGQDRGPDTGSLPPLPPPMDSPLVEELSPQRQPAERAAPESVSLASSCEGSRVSGGGYPRDTGRPVSFFGKGARLPDGSSPLPGSPGEHAQPGSHVQAAAQQVPSFGTASRAAPAPTGEDGSLREAPREESRLGDPAAAPERLLRESVKAQPLSEATRSRISAPGSSSSHASADGDGAQAVDRASREREATGGFATRDPVQVWSNTKGEWLDGVVLQAFPEDCESQGYSVPAGTLKVSSAAGMKWVRPGQATSMLRHMPSPPT